MDHYIPAEGVDDGHGCKLYSFLGTDLNRSYFFTCNSKNVACYSMFFLFYFFYLSALQAGGVLSLLGWAGSGEWQHLVYTITHQELHALCCGGDMLHIKILDELNFDLYLTFLYFCVAF